MKVDEYSFQCHHHPVSNNSKQIMEEDILNYLPTCHVLWDTLYVYIDVL